MKKVLLVIGLFGSLSSMFGQRNCGTMQYMQKLQENDPAVSQRLQAIENQTSEFINNNVQGKSNGVNAVINIPVVVHVVYNTTAQNISDAQIQSQIAVLNEDFRRLNADKINTPSSFTSVAADAEITFCLATKAPNGSATTGIIRKSTSVLEFAGDDKVKYASQGGSDAWPTGSYLNLWVCNLSGSLLGYAQFPGGPAATDGVVISYKYFGRGYASVAPFNKGRTGTHEVGHWLNLRHIWGDASCGSDLVNDTPTQQTSNYGCPAYPHKTCGNTTSGDMFMNYMDYTDDGCMNMFSNGQKARMQALFAAGGARASLLSSTGCSGTSTVTGYCSANATNASYEWISNVKLGTINNTSGANGGYANFTNLSTNLTIGTNNIITLTPAFSGSSYPEYFKVYIDYNKDKDFADAGELVYTSAATTLAVNGSFVIPSTVSTGSTRMRVIMKDGTISGPCEQYTYGEVEDYTVNFVSTIASQASTLTIGTGTASSGNAPYGTYYMDERCQFIVTKSELVAAGYNSVNNLINSLSFNVSTLSSQVMNGFTIKIGHTSVSSFSSATFSSPAMTTVYSANYTAISGWNKHTFTTPFNYNGTSNLLIEICWNNSSYTTDSKVFTSATPDNKTLYYKADVASGGVCANTSGNLSTARPNMKLTLSSGGGTAKETLAEETNEMLITSALELFPNPAATDITISYQLEQTSEVSYEVYSVTGAVILTENLGLQEAGKHVNEVSLNKQDISNGVYLCVLKTGNKVQSKRFVIAK